MRTTTLALLLVVVAVVVVVATTTTFVSAEEKDEKAKQIDDTDLTNDPHLKHTTVVDGMDADEVRLAGHLAYYALVSLLKFPDMASARDALSDLAAGRTNFRQLSEDLNKQWMLKGATKQSSGEVGLVTMKDLKHVPHLAKLLFDIRNPEAGENDMNLFGPVQEEDGVWLGATFKRYRKQFFSEPWWELDHFCREVGMGTEDMLQLIENYDRLWQTAFMLWPDEHTSFKRLKIRQIKADFRKVGADDPAVRMPEPKKKMDPHLHKARIDERIAFMKRIEPHILHENPEIYAMGVDEIRERGWHPDDAAAKRAKERYASQSKTNEAGEQEIDPSMFAH